MKKQNHGRRISILSKTSFVCGLIILILLTANSYLAIRFESGLADSMIKVFSSNQKTALTKDTARMKTALENDMKINLEICTSVTREFLYNFNQDQLFKLLSSYLKLDNITAIKVLDADGQPFGAAWKAPDIKTAEALPGDAGVNETLSVVQNAVKDGETLGSVRLYYTDAQMKNKIKDHEADTLNSIQAFNALAQKNIGTAIKSQVAIAVVIIIVLILTLVVSLTIFVTRPINSTIAMIRDIAQGEGDLTRRLQTNTRDEIGELAAWFNRFVENLQQLIREISGNATTIDQSSTSFLAVSDNMNNQVAGLSERSVSLGHAAEHISRDIISVTAAMEEASTNINMMATASEEMSATIAEIAQNTEKARQITDNAVSQTQQSSSEVNKLGGAADTIGKVAETITEISNQVNLLALNATIEAARAGEAGKGFAVVANEIKVLAGQTTEASDAIREQIQSIQAASTRTVDAISGTAEIVGEINTIVATIAAAVEQQSATTGEISGNISQTASGITEITETVSQGASAVQEMVKDITDVKEDAAGLSTAGHEVKTNAQNLSELGNRLAGLMCKFKV